MSVAAKVIRDDVRAMTAYAVHASAGMVKLDAMENPYRLPESLQGEIASCVAQAAVNRYPDPLAPALKARLREGMSIPDGFEILLGNGSDEIIQIMIQACARPGTVIMAPSPTFAMYRQYALIAGLKYVGVPLRADFSLDVRAFLEAMEEHRPATVFLSYPNNPSGNSFDRDGMDQILRRAPGLVVIDEAYQPFAADSFLGRLCDYPNVVLLRTVSKLGLAGIRLGYAVGLPEWMNEFDKVRSPYNVSILTQLVAERVLAHPDVFAAQAAAIRAERHRLGCALSELPHVYPFPSQANFVLARVPDADRTERGLRERNILIKNLHGMHPLLAQCLRFTVGTPEENSMLIGALGELLGGAHGTAPDDRVA